MSLFLSVVLCAPWYWYLVCVCVVFIKKIISSSCLHVDVDTVYVTSCARPRPAVACVVMYTCVMCAIFLITISALEALCHMSYMSYVPHIVYVCEST